MSHIFISYAKVDTRDLAEGLFQALNELEGFSAWMDESLEPASSWALQIQKEIDKADIVLVLLSPDVNRAESLNQRRSFVLNEIDYAQQAHKRILPIMAQKTNMPVQIAGVQYIDFTQDPNKGYERLVRTLERLNASQKVTVSSAIDEAKTPAPFTSPKQPQKQGGRWVWASIIGILLIVGIGGSILLANLGKNPTETPESTGEVAFEPSETPTATLDPVDGTLTAIFEDLAQAGEATAASIRETQSILETEQAYNQATETSVAISTQVAERLATDITWTPSVTYTPDISVTADAASTSTRLAQIYASGTQASVSLANTNSTSTQESILNEALHFARTRMTSNEQWTELYPNGFIWEFEDGIQMVLVPSGCFRIGSETGSRDEQPSHLLCFDNPFWIDRTEVSQSDFIRLNGVKAEANSSLGDDLPVNTITWIEAIEYCSLRNARLPRESEWEYAAKGIDGLTYPWGNTFSQVNAIYQVNSGNRLHTVNSRPNGVSWIGAMNMSGNVWEWTNSHFLPYPYDENDGRELYTNIENRTIRGGGFDNGSTNLRTTARYGYPIDYQSNNLGFRCARSIED